MSLAFLTAESLQKPDIAEFPDQEKKRVWGFHPQVGIRYQEFSCVAVIQHTQAILK